MRQASMTNLLRKLGLSSIIDSKAKTAQAQAVGSSSSSISSVANSSTSAIQSSSKSGSSVSVVLGSASSTSISTQSSSKSISSSSISSSNVGKIINSINPSFGLGLNATNEIRSYSSTDSKIVNLTFDSTTNQYKTNTNQCLQFEGFGMAPKMATCDSTKNEQKWESFNFENNPLKPVIRTKNKINVTTATGSVVQENLCLDVDYWADGTFKNDQRVVNYYCWGGENQNWQLVTKNSGLSSISSSVSTSSSNFSSSSNSSSSFVFISSPSEVEVKIPAKNIDFKAFVECVDDGPNDTFSAVFGYLNRQGQRVNLDTNYTSGMTSTEIASLSKLTPTRPVIHTHFDIPKVKDFAIGSTDETPIKNTAISYIKATSPQPSPIGVGASSTASSSSTNSTTTENRAMVAEGQGGEILKWEFQVSGQKFVIGADKGFVKKCPKPEIKSITPSAVTVSSNNIQTAQAQLLETPVTTTSVNTDIQVGYLAMAKGFDLTKISTASVIQQPTNLSSTNNKPELYNYTGESSQKWQYDNITGQIFAQVGTVNSVKNCLKADNNIRASVVILVTCDLNSDLQKWSFLPTGQIVLKSTLALPTSSNGSSSSNSSSSLSVSLTNANSLCLDVITTAQGWQFWGNQLSVWTCSGTENQNFVFAKTGSITSPQPSPTGAGVSSTNSSSTSSISTSSLNSNSTKVGFITLASEQPTQVKATNLILETPENTTKAASRTQFNYQLNSSNQLWQYDPLTLELRQNFTSSKGENLTLCLDGTASRKLDWAISYPCYGGDNQKWLWLPTGELLLKNSVNQNNDNSVGNLNFGANNAFSNSTNPDELKQAKWCLNLDSTTNKAGAGLNLNSCNNSTTQKFALNTNDLLTVKNTLASTKGYLTSRQNDKWLLQSPINPSGETKAEVFAKTGEYNQKWYLDPISLEIKMILDNKPYCLDVGTGERASSVAIKTCSGNDNQKWYLETDGSITLKNSVGTNNSALNANLARVTSPTSPEYAKTRWCLDIPYGNIFSHQGMIVWECNTGAWQKWNLEVITSEGYIDPNTALVLDTVIEPTTNNNFKLEVVEGLDLENNQVYLAPTNRAFNQRFKFNSQSKEILFGSRCLDYSDDPVINGNYNPTNKWGAALVLKTCNGSNRQKWNIDTFKGNVNFQFGNILSPNSNFNITNLDTRYTAGSWDWAIPQYTPNNNRQLCLDAQWEYRRGQFYDGQKLSLQPCQGENNQNFVIRPLTNTGTNTNLNYNNDWSTQVSDIPTNKPTLKGTINSSGTYATCNGANSVGYFSKRSIQGSQLQLYSPCRAYGGGLAQLTNFNNSGTTGFNTSRKVQPAIDVEFDSNSKELKFFNPDGSKYTYQSTSIWGALDPLTSDAENGYGSNTAGKPNGNGAPGNGACLTAYYSDTGVKADINANGTNTTNITTTFLGIPSANIGSTVGGGKNNYNNYQLSLEKCNQSWNQKWINNTASDKIRLMGTDLCLQAQAKDDLSDEIYRNGVMDGTAVVLRACDYSKDLLDSNGNQQDFKLVASDNSIRTVYSHQPRYHNSQVVYASTNQQISTPSCRQFGYTNPFTMSSTLGCIFDVNIQTQEDFIKFSVPIYQWTDQLKTKYLETRYRYEVQQLADQVKRACGTTPLIPTSGGISGNQILNQINISNVNNGNTANNQYCQQQQITYNNSQALKYLQELERKKAQELRKVQPSPQTDTANGTGNNDLTNNNTTNPNNTTGTNTNPSQPKDFPYTNTGGTTSKATTQTAYEIAYLFNQDLVMDLQQANTTNTTPIWLYQRNNTNAQKWFYFPVTGEIKTSIGKLDKGDASWWTSLKCVDAGNINPNGGGNNNLLTINTCNGQQSQSWYFNNDYTIILRNFTFNATNTSGQKLLACIDIGGSSNPNGTAGSGYGLNVTNCDYRKNQCFVTQLVNQTNNLNSQPCTNNLTTPMTDVECANQYGNTYWKSTGKVSGVLCENTYVVPIYTSNNSNNNGAFPARYFKTGDGTGNKYKDLGNTSGNNSNYSNYNNTNTTNGTDANPISEGEVTNQSYDIEITKNSSYDRLVEKARDVGGDFWQSIDFIVLEPVKVNYSDCGGNWFCIGASYNDTNKSRFKFAVDSVVEYIVKFIEGILFAIGQQFNLVATVNAIKDSIGKIGDILGAFWNLLTNPSKILDIFTDKLAEFTDLAMWNKFYFLGKTIANMVITAVTFVTIGASLASFTINLLTAPVKTLTGVANMAKVFVGQTISNGIRIYQLGERIIVRGIDIVNKIKNGLSELEFSTILQSIRNATTKDKLVEYYKAVKSGGCITASYQPSWIDRVIGFGGIRGEAAIIFCLKIPQKARDRLDYILKNNGNAGDGYVGNSIFYNRDGQLPTSLTFKEYDVNPYISGVNRGAERIVVGSNGKAWYTPNHYNDFIPLN
jgi:ribonuclease/Ricin-type beta-trefoil lectin domain